MAIIATNKGGDFTPAPEGLWPAVCVDVVDKGMVESAQYKPRHMVQLRWVLEAEPPLETGKPHMAVRSFGLSLGEMSHLRPFLEAWRGKKFTEDELAGFDLEKLIGVNCQIQIIHNRKNGKVYGNVQGVVPLGKGMAKMIVPADYVRQAERDHQTQLESQPDGTSNEGGYADEISDDDIPF